MLSKSKVLLNLLEDRQDIQAGLDYDPRDGWILSLYKTRGLGRKTGTLYTTININNLLDYEWKKKKLAKGINHIKGILHFEWGVEPLDDYGSQHEFHILSIILKLDSGEHIPLEDTPELTRELRNLT